MSDVNPYMRRLGLRIAEARNAAGVTQQQLAGVLGLTRPSVTNMETGRQSVDAVQLAQIARALRTGLDVLLPPDDLPPEPVLPHVVEIKTVYEVTCLTCGPGRPLDAPRSREGATQARADHIAEMQERDAARPGASA